MDAAADSVLGELAAMWRRAEAREHSWAERRGPRGVGSMARRGWRSAGRGGGA